LWPLASCGRKAASQETQEPPPTPVEVINVTTGVLEKTVDVSGAIFALNDVPVTAKIMGKVARVFVKEGDKVRRGQLLFQLEDREARANRDQAKAAVAQAEARLDQAIRGYSLQQEQTSSGLAQAQAALAAARARLKQAQEGEELQQQQTSAEVKRATAALEAAQARLAQAQSGSALTAETVETGVEQARATVAAAQAALDALRSGARQEEKRQADFAVDQARVARDTAKADLDRAEQLLQSGAIARQQYDSIRANWEMAEARYQTALQQRDLVYKGPREEELRAAEERLKQAQAAYQQAVANARQRDIQQQEVEAARTAVTQAEALLTLARANEAQNRVRAEEVRAAQAALAQAEAAYALAKASETQNRIREKDIVLARAALQQSRAGLALAEETLSNTRVTSPVSGAVAQSELDVGEMVGPTMPVMRLVSTSAVSFKGYLSEADVAQIRVGQRAWVRVDAYEGMELPGEVVKILPAADPQSHTFIVKISLDNPEGKLKEGMFARARIVVQRSQGLPVIPLDAVLRDEKGESVMVVQGDRAAKKSVVLGLQVKNHAAVEFGLSPGEKLVVSGQRNLAAGATVRVVQVRQNVAD